MDNVLVDNGNVTAANGDAPLVQSNNALSLKNDQKLYVFVPISNGIDALLSGIVGGMDYNRKLTV